MVLLQSQGNSQGRFKLTFLTFKATSLATGAVVFLGGGLFAGMTGSAIAATPTSSGSASKDIQVQTEAENSESTPTTNPSSGSTQTSVANRPRFTCEMLNGQYTVVYHPESRPSESYPWATPSQLGGGWTPQARCQEISRRLELYRPDGLQEMRTAVENNYNTVCVTTEKNSSCRIVLTVPPNQDPLTTRDRVFQNLTIADSGQQTQAANTFVGSSRVGNSRVDGSSRGGDKLDELVNLGASLLGGRQERSSNINLRPFLDPADGGTGSKLGQGMSTRNNPRLNPANFR
ncbi:MULTISPECIES: COP23 domain-containing protein [Trichocoleus]|uniref:COP23 domain-containing protein n=1 Tax=Trichocoleus desertorum GB2-A4 TaxID=2933944 RepID=A0ABV0JEW4_9CYAN|nr:COP23 domain-containing protein [Trichocoleus sp. FACHB-46]